MIPTRIRPDRLERLKADLHEVAAVQAELGARLAALEGELFHQKRILNALRRELDPPKRKIAGPEAGAERLMAERCKQEGRKIGGQEDSAVLREEKNLLSPAFLSALFDFDIRRTMDH